MRTRRIEARVVWLCLILHLFAGTGFANGLVICIAPGGHLAVESPHFGTGCVAANEAREAADVPSTVQNGSQRACEDTPVFISGQRFTPASAVDITPPPTQAAVVTAPAAPPVYHRAPATTDSFSVSESLALQSLKTVVLLV